MRIRAAIVWIGLAACAGGGFAQEAVDYERLNAVRAKQRLGQELSDEDRAYIARVQQLRRERAEQFRREHPPRDSVGLTPLTELGSETYQTDEGGLYPGGGNQPPEAHLQAGLARAERIAPLGPDGKPAPDGKIVLLSIGMSNTTQEFQAFMEAARGDAELNPAVVLVDGAQGGQAADVTADPADPYWQVVEERLAEASVTAGQVQAVWVKQAIREPTKAYPADVKKLQGYIRETVQNLARRFPNLLITYLSSRIYAGYAAAPLNPEPHAYESAFAVKWLIGDQIDGHQGLNYNPSKGEINAPWLAWGPYLWADGVNARADGLTYLREDLADDGTHPSALGRKKVARLLLEFFKTDPTARPWFVR